MNNTAIVVAGGSGKRFGGSLPKQFVPLMGKEIFIRSVEI
ncbi:MAG: 2-C-methyl-D-erythritol 4-phosphate cytidylyltransferase, partial [Kosmotoga sp.]